jgi:hypothetical protein
MEFANPFIAPGKWYKGNLHTHTGKSDGQLDPEEVVRRYRGAGYDFLALTDHGIVARVEHPSDGNFLLMLGVEMSGDRCEAGEPVHVVAFGLSEAGEAPRQPRVAEAVEWTKQHGGEVLIGHPYWTGMLVSDLMRWEGHLGVEIFNTGCHFELGKGYSTIHWDDALGRGLRMWGFAVDDSHHRPRPPHLADTARAWVMVKAPELTREALLASLRAGLFYSSWGPTIEELTVGDGEVRVRTSPVKRINFIAQRWAGESAWPEQEMDTLTEASYRLQGHEQFLRVECEDPTGRWAWTNPIMF